MAKKDLKFDKYDLEFKNKVLKEFLEGSSAGYLSQKMISQKKIRYLHGLK